MKISTISGYGLGLIALCLAACTNAPIGNPLDALVRSSEKAFATKIPMLMPARSPEAAALHSMAVAVSGQPLTQSLGRDVEAAMIKLRVQEKPFYERVKLIDALPVPVLNEGQLLELARSQAVAGVLGLSNVQLGSARNSSREDRVECRVGTKLFQLCPKDQTFTRPVSCHETTATASVHVRVLRAQDRRSVFSDTVKASSSQKVCDDDQATARLLPEQLQGKAFAALSAAVLSAVAPSYEERSLDMKSADAKLPEGKRAAFTAALDFARAKRMEEACARFNELYEDFKESVALTYNMGFCQEAGAQLLRASQTYRRASELQGGPDAAIDEHLANVERHLREMPPASLLEANGPGISTGVVGGRRVALVMGNARYDKSALVNPVNDARLVADKLKRIGFDVTTVENANGARLSSSVNDFAARAKGADVALFYYAGHAIQAEGENLLMPVDNAKMRDSEDVRSHGGLALGRLLAQLDAAKPKVKLVVVDACRDNPLPAVSRSLAGGGLAPIEQPAEGTLVAFATSAGRTAEDGVSKNSVFTKHFSNLLGTPGLAIENLFKQVREAVRKETKNRQEPTEMNSLIGEVVLVPKK